MSLGSPRSAVISAIVFNAIVIPLLIPISLKGVGYRPIGASALLRRNLLIYGLGGLDRPVHRHQADRPDRPQPAGRDDEPVAVLGARLHRRAIDRDLASGVASWRSPAHAIRVRQLTHPRHRRRARRRARSPPVGGDAPRGRSWRTARSSRAEPRFRPTRARSAGSPRRLRSDAAGRRAPGSRGSRRSCPTAPGRCYAEGRASALAGALATAGRWLERRGMTPMAVTRGRHKVFLGMAAGVGKTYRMLQEGQAEALAGRDVVIGYLEPHGRVETVEQAAGLEVVPRRRVRYRDTAAGGDGPAGGPGPRPRAVPHRRAGPHQRPRDRASQALRGRPGRPGHRHRRVLQRQRPASGEPQRPGRRAHRHAGPRDRARRGPGRRRRRRAHRHHPGLTDRAPARRQGLSARSGSRRR